MLKYKFINIKTKGNRKLSYFKSLGYDISKDIILIDINHLNSGSRELVNVICDFCDKEVIIHYKEYLRNIKIGNKYACCKLCGSKKAKETCIDKYGVENALMLESTKEKQKKTNKEKYGVEYLQQSHDIREKSKKTILEKYNVSHISKTEKHKKLSSDWMSSDEFKRKSKETLEKNYGVDNPSKSIIIKDRIKETLSLFSKDDWINIRNKYKSTMLTRYGSNNPPKCESIRLENFKISNHPDYIQYLNNGISKFKCNNCNDEFEIKSDNFCKRINLKIPLCTICYPIDKKISIMESELMNFIKGIYNKKIIEKYRDELEIDIYLPDLKIGFEFNGLYWHSDKYKDKYYHIKKTNYFKDRGIRLIHIWEDDWINKNEILKSQIFNWLGLTKNKVYARKCFVKEIDSKTCKEFLNNNHIQGTDKNILRIGLYYDNNLLSIMTFNQFEGRNKMDKNCWNLSRFCNKVNYTVIGGASKIFKYFITNYNPIRVVSYADRNWSFGKLYESLKFDKLYDTNPDYKYIINGIRKHKSNFKRKKLNTNLSESNEMKSRNILKVWDCGKIKYEKIF